MRTLRPVLLAVVLAFGGCGDSQSPIAPVPDGELSMAAAPGDGRPLSARLSGANEAPGPGDPDGTGLARVRLDQGASIVCWEITWRNIAEPTAAHIHRGAVGVPGPVVVTLSPIASGCTAAPSALIKEIRKNPAAFYVNVHNEDFPGGAIRGQLTK